MAGANIPFGAATRIAGEVDSVYLFITGVAVFFFLLTQGLLIYFAVKYRKRKGEKERDTPYITSNRILEGVWIAVPTLLVMTIFAYGYKVWEDMRTPLAGAEEINVTARQWLYKFKYPDGRTAVNELRVPVGQPVQLTMTSEDVIHGFFIPDYRIKQDILPGRYTYLWFQPDKAGTYTIFCTQYCGVGHSGMLAHLIVMSQEDYHAWESTQSEQHEKGMPLADKGGSLVEKYGCLACHSLDGTIKVGPSFKGLFGGTVVFVDGSTAVADEDYIRQCILEPNVKVLKGFKPLMPTFKGMASDEDITAIISFLKSISGRPGIVTVTGFPGEEGSKESPETLAKAGAELVKNSGCLACHTTDGTKKVGPTFKGLYGSRVPLEGGATVAAVDAYIRESLYEPGAKVVKGYQNIMPSYKGTISDRDVDAITEYIKTLK